ncbi:hypothetical protein D3C78_1380570 [compost metagenome]
MTQVLGETVGHGGGATGQQQLHAHRAANDVGRANHNGIQTIGIDVVTLEQGHDAAWGTWAQFRRALAQTADVERVETVNVFIRMNTLQHFDVIDAGRQWQLDQDAVDLAVGIQPVDQRQQFGLTGGGRQIVGAREETHLITGAALAADVNL